jgi:hypothetical protein
LKGGNSSGEEKLVNGRLGAEATTMRKLIELGFIDVKIRVINERVVQKYVVSERQTR